MANLAYSYPGVQSPNAASAGSALMGAAAGMSPWTQAIPILGGLLGGLFGNNEPQMPWWQDYAFRFNRNIARDKLRYSKGVPGSDPQEQAALAQSNALLGSQFGQQRDAYGAASSPWGANAGNNTDLMANLDNMLGTNRASMLQNHFLDSLTRRQNAQGEAAQIMGQAAGTAGGGYQQQQPNIAGNMQAMAQQMAYSQMLSRLLGQQNTGRG